MVYADMEDSFDSTSIRDDFEIDHRNFHPTRGRARSPGHTIDGLQETRIYNVLTKKGYESCVE